jgi:hypothetical protein
VYSLYKSLYQEVTIARMIADAWSGIIYETYSIKEGSDASEKTLAEDFVNSKNFPEASQSCCRISTAAFSPQCYLL